MNVSKEWLDEHVKEFEDALRFTEPESRVAVATCLAGAMIAEEVANVSSTLSEVAQNLDYIDNKLDSLIDTSALNGIQEAIEELTKAVTEKSK
jgi:hypothetical protein